MKAKICFFDYHVESAAPLRERDVWNSKQDSCTFVKFLRMKCCNSIVKFSLIPLKCHVISRCSLKMTWRCSKFVRLRCPSERKSKCRRHHFPVFFFFQLSWLRGPQLTQEWPFCIPSQLWFTNPALFKRRIGIATRRTVKWLFAIDSGVALSVRSRQLPLPYVAVH